MSNSAAFLVPLQRYVNNPISGVLGFVEEILAIAGEHDISFVWQAGLCVVTTADSIPQDRIELPLSKPVFRAVLARFAVLCNEHTPASVDPYGGEGRIAVGTDPIKTVAVKFMNTPEIQNLELTAMKQGEALINGKNAHEFTRTLPGSV